MAATRNAPIAWAQRDNLIYLTIELDTIKIDELTITPTSFKFKGTAPDAVYESNFEFYAEVNKDDVKKSSSTRYIELSVGKKEESWWPRLLKDKVKMHWLKVDFSKWREEDESDNEAGAPGGMGGGMNFDNFDLSQYASQLGGGMDAPGLDDFEDDDGDMPDLEDDEEAEGKGKENGEKKE